ncbi:hypothetical protein GCM10025867_08850 [Frondihabitans sucicola]|uniref:Uncharacterized protein n=1 Tax=Frondihabitans sucicola TaxID=1268041 RepID=A0ABM8GJS8_9MICO|nr:hypothetical protein [Frondihabitans sucicola]BDZ48644.1 hypothetical protein GCM10025867_08850 [Frondihabitans sucicola]
MEDPENGLEQLGLGSEELPPAPGHDQPWWVATSSLPVSIALTALWVIAAVTAFLNLPTSISSQDAWRLVVPVLATLLVILSAPSIIYNAIKHER